MWQRWNGTTKIFEKSSDNGVVWTPLGLDGSIITQGRISLIDRFSANAADGVSDNNYVADIRNNESTPGRSFGLFVHAGTNENDSTFFLRNVSGLDLFRVSGVGVVTNTAGGASRRGSVGSNTGVPTALFTMDSGDQVALYLVRCGIGTSSMDATNYGAFATIAVEGNSARIVANNTSTVAISLSGLTVLGSQSSGSTVALKWAAIKIV